VRRARSRFLLYVAIAVVAPGVAWSLVNDPPVISIPSSPSALEDTDTLIAGVSVSDPENGTLTVDQLFPWNDLDHGLDVLRERHEPAYRWRSRADGFRQRQRDARQRFNHE
jgi:hypothetical protein